MDVAPKALLKVVDVTIRWDVTPCAVPVAKRGWIAPLTVLSVEAFVLICLRTQQKKTNLTKKHKLSSSHYD